MRICKIDGCDSTDLATRSAMCRVHHREYTKVHYRENKQKYIDKAKRNSAITIAFHKKIIIKHLLHHPCVDCGNNDIEVLEFDHRDRDLKIAEISKFVGGNTQKLLNEMAKCDIRCANCHVKKTRRQLGWWRTKDSIADSAGVFILGYSKLGDSFGDSEGWKSIPTID